MEQYHVTGMACAACSAHVEKAVIAVDGVSSVTVSLLTNAMSVEGTASPQAVIAAVEKAGYGASLAGASQEEATTAADLDGVTGDKRVCVLGDGPVVSFMDGATIYDRALYRMARETADENGIPSQTKTAIAGGNDAGALQRAGQGSAALAVSLPCRYIHSGASVVQQSDIDATRALLAALLPKLYD